MTEKDISYLFRRSVAMAFHLISFFITLKNLFIYSSVWATIMCSFYSFCFYKHIGTHAHTYTHTRIYITLTTYTLLLRIKRSPAFITIIIKAFVMFHNPHQAASSIPFFQPLPPIHICYSSLWLVHFFFLFGKPIIIC